MKKFKDRIVLGVCCALLASLPPKLANTIEYRLGLTDEQYNQTGSSFFLPKEEAKSNSMASKVVGSLVNNTVVGFTGVVLAYLLSISGRDRAVIKGALFGALEWVAIWGLTGKLGMKVRSRKAATHLLSFFDHVIFGAGTAWLVSKLGDDSLYPDMKVSSPEEKLPIVPTPPRKLTLSPRRRRRLLKGTA
ncbi:MAG: hypothetical protein AB1500_05540 [Bacillota bacterium]